MPRYSWETPTDDDDDEIVDDEVLRDRDEPATPVDHLARVRAEIAVLSADTSTAESGYNPSARMGYTRPDEAEHYEKMQKDQDARRARLTELDAQQNELMREVLTSDEYRNAVANAQDSAELQAVMRRYGSPIAEG